MFEITVKFENDYDKESFIASITKSFNNSGKYNSVHANTLERVGETLFFTRQDVELASVPSDAVVEEIDISDSSQASSATGSGADVETVTQPVPENDGLPTETVQDETPVQEPTEEVTTQPFSPDAEFSPSPEPMTEVL